MRFVRTAESSPPRSQVWYQWYHKTHEALGAGVKERLQESGEIIQEQQRQIESQQETIGELEATVAGLGPQYKSPPKSPAKSPAKSPSKSPPKSPLRVLTGKAVGDGQLEQLEAHQNQIRDITSLQKTLQETLEAHQSQIRDINQTVSEHAVWMESGWTLQGAEWLEMRLPERLESIEGEMTGALDQVSRHSTEELLSRWICVVGGRATETGGEQC